MKKYASIIASFIIMLCLGSVYAWSIIASELNKNYKFTAFQSQLIFGIVIALFPVTMIFVSKLAKKFQHRYLGYLSGCLFFAGYLIASASQGSFFLILLGFGIFVGIATGFGYWLSLTAPIHWFPHKKGLVTGIAAAGFGSGAIVMSELSHFFLSRGYNVLFVLKTIGITYGLLIMICSMLIYQKQSNISITQESTRVSTFIKTSAFKNMFLGIFLGTFAGLLIIGSLKAIGEQFGIQNNTLMLSVALFSVANFSGRIFWGYVSDKIQASLCICHPSTELTHPRQTN